MHCWLVLLGVPCRHASRYSHAPALTPPALPPPALPPPMCAPSGRHRWTASGRQRYRQWEAEAEAEAEADAYMLTLPRRRLHATCSPCLAACIAGSGCTCRRTSFGQHSSKAAKQQSSSPPNSNSTKQQPTKQQRYQTASCLWSSGAKRVEQRGWSKEDAEGTKRMRRERALARALLLCSLYC